MGKTLHNLIESFKEDKCQLYGNIAAMARVSSEFVCQQCGYRSPQFLGRCPECGTWNSLVEEQVTGAKQQTAGKAISLPTEVINISDIRKEDYDRFSSNIDEFDRVLGGGIVKGSVVLVSGDPGIGKSTLLSQLAINFKDTLYVAGEESARQIKLRIDRMRKGASLKVLNEVDVDAVINSIKSVKPSLAIVDSIQTMQTQDLTSAPGSVGQVRESAHRLQRLAKLLHIPIFIVGHVTKEGTVAGPRTLEHLVDVVISLEGESNNQFRVLRSTKNRFGPTDEVGIFEMEDSGMKEVKNPSGLFVSSRITAPGSSIICVMTGLRPLLVEIQALVSKSQLPIPRRVGTGIDNNRLQLLIAVLAKRLNLPLYDQDIFVNVTGGLRIFEPAADLGICAAIASSLKEKTVDPKAVFIGEVGLLGEIRSVTAEDKRSREAKKLGFKNLISPSNSKSIAQALKQALI